MSIDLGRRLVAAGTVSAEEVEAALFLSVVRGIPLARILIDRGAISERALEQELDRVGGLALRHVVGAAEIVARLPRSMCRRLSALPIRVDPETGVIDIAASDPLDPHITSEFGYHLTAPIRVVRAPVSAIEDAIRRLELDEQEAPERIRPRRMTPPFPHGAPTSEPPPPPDVDASPIPLVRRVAGPGLPYMTERPPAVSFNDHEVPSLPPLAAPRFAVTAPPPVGYTSPARPSGPPPLVSPPPLPQLDNDGIPQRNTPPYGTPILTPGGAPRSSDPPSGDEASFGPGRPTPVPDSGVARTRVVPDRGVSRRTARPPLHMELSSLIPSKSKGPSPSEFEPEPPPQPPGPRRIRAPEGAPVLEGLGLATDRDEIIRLILRGMRLVARRVSVFVVRRDGYHGWACNVAFGDVEALREVHVPPDQPSIFATATATAMYLGPVPTTPIHEPLLQLMDQASTDVAATAVRVQGRPAMVLVADDLEDTMVSTRFLLAVAKAAGEALSRILSGGR